MHETVTVVLDTFVIMLGKRSFLVVANCFRDATIIMDATQLVTYRPCPRCGFRLMRSERVNVEDEYDTHASCPICGREILGGMVRCEGALLTANKRYQAWKAWLRKMDLTPETLRHIYHLEMKDFFAETDASAVGLAPQL